MHPLLARIRSASPRLRTAAAFGLVLAAALHAAWSTLDRGFLCDDFAYIGRFHALAWSEWPSLFVRDWSGGLWGYNLPELRPFAALTFLIDARLWGTNPLGWHLTNLLLDTGCACLVLLIVWRLHGAALWAGCAAGILFAWHPAHAEPVAWITGRVDLLGTLAYLIGFLAGGLWLRDGGSRRWLLAAWLAYFVGCFAKEFCLTLPLALGLWWLCYRPHSPAVTARQAGLLFGGFVLIAAGFLLCRRLAFGPGSGSGFALNLFSAAFAERQLDYLRWFLPPLYDFGRDYRPYLVRIAPVLIVGGLLLSIAVLALWHWRGPATTRWRAALFYGLGWYLIATLPMAAAGYFSPRHLYLATAGLAVWAGLLAGSWAGRRWLACGAIVLAGLFCAGRFEHAVAPWRRAAKISERLSAEIARQLPQLQPGELLLLDVPAVHEGVWLWSWAAPFALQPPFQKLSAADRALTRPAAYYAPHLWTQQPAFAALTEATGAVLITLDAKGAPVTRHCGRAELNAAARRLATAAAGDPDVAWREFVATLPGQ
jgi:hypothetical protein